MVSTYLRTSFSNAYKVYSCLQVTFGAFHKCQQSSVCVDDSCTSYVNVAALSNVYELF